VRTALTLAIIALLLSIPAIGCPVNNQCCTDSCPRQAMQTCPLFTLEKAQSVPTVHAAALPLQWIPLALLVAFVALRQRDRVPTPTALRARVLRI
jgi:hypothetical protein